MKKVISFFMCVTLCLGLGACQKEPNSTVNAKSTSDTVDSDISNTSEKEIEKLQKEIFNDLTISDKDVITVDFDVTLTGNNATFLAIEVTENTKAILHFTYSTQNESGLKIGYYPEESDDKTEFDLSAEPDDAYDSVWVDEDVSLKKGMNVFYISGDANSCKMHMEVNELDKDIVSYVGAYTRDEALEKIDNRK